MRGAISRLLRNTFLMNALYLMLSTFVVAAAGFLFWVVVARRYDAATVGEATTLLSVSGLLSLVGQAGFDAVFVRFLPGEARKNDYINTGLLIVASISACLAIAAALILPAIVPGLALLRTPGAGLLFTFFTAVTSLNTVTNAIFLSFKQARIIFIINALFSGLKIILPLLVADGDAMTIFVLAGVAQLVGLVLSIVWMRRRFAYVVAPKIHMAAVRAVRKFSSVALVANILNLLPPTVLPLLVIATQGAEQAAYYYMAFTIASVLYTIAYASMQSVFAEGSHDRAALRTHVVKAARLMAVLLVPAAVACGVLSPWLLGIFGVEYARGAAPLLQILSLAALPVAMYSALGAIFKVRKNLRGLAAMNVVYATVTVGASSMMLSQYGDLSGLGWAWIMGNVAACLVGGLFVLKRKGKGGNYYAAASTSR